MAEAANASGIVASMAAALGLRSDEKDRALAQSLQAIYDEEMAYHQGVYEMARAIKASLAAVRKALGPPGAIDPANVPTAAAVLGELATAFAALEADCKSVGRELQESIDRLRDAA